MQAEHSRPRSTSERASMGGYSKNEVMSKKIIAAIVCGLLLNLASQAQTYKGSIGIAAGYGIPMGQFGNLDINDDDAGYANRGSFLEISLTHQIGEDQFGFAALVRRQHHSTEVQALGDDLENQLPGTTWTVESTDWRLGAVMVGGYGSFALFGQLSLDVKSMIGLLLSDSPELILAGEGPLGAIGSVQSSVSTSSLAYLFGVGLKVGVGPKFFLSGHVDYMGSAPHFSGVQVTNSDGTIIRGSIRQDIGLLNVGVGLAYRFTGI